MWLLAEWQELACAEQEGQEGCSALNFEPRELQAWVLPDKTLDQINFPSTADSKGAALK